MQLYFRSRLELPKFSYIISCGNVKDNLKLPAVDVDLACMPLYSCMPLIRHALTFLDAYSY